MKMENLKNNQLLVVKDTDVPQAGVLKESMRFILLPPSSVPQALVYSVVPGADLSNGITPQSAVNTKLPQGCFNAGVIQAGVVTGLPTSEVACTASASHFVTKSRNICSRIYNTENTDPGTSGSTDCSECSGRTSKCVCKTCKPELYNDVDVCRYMRDSSKGKEQTCETFEKTSHRDKYNNCKEKGLLFSCDVQGDKSYNLEKVMKVKNNNTFAPCEEKMYSCNGFQKRFLIKGNLQVHQVSCKEKRKCWVCNKIFYDLKSLTDHLQSHNSEKTDVHSRRSEEKINCHLCYECGKMFTSRRKKSKHYLQRHSTKENFPYSLCGKVFKTSREYMHCFHHLCKNSFDCCLVCGTWFGDPLKVREHMNGHANGMKYECHTCGKKFEKKSYITYHMFEHTENEWYECEICRKCFIENDDFKAHIIQHLGFHKSQPVEDPLFPVDFGVKSTLKEYPQTIGDIMAAL